MFAYPSYDAEFRGSNPVGVVLALRPQRHRPGGAKTRYSLCVRQLVRQNLPFFLAATLAGFGLRLFFLLKFPHVTADSNFYADLADLRAAARLSSVSGVRVRAVRHRQFQSRHDRPNPGRSWDLRPSR